MLLLLFPLKIQKTCNLRNYTELHTCVVHNSTSFKAQYKAERICFSKDIIMRGKNNKVATGTRYTTNNIINGQLSQTFPSTRSRIICVLIQQEEERGAQYANKPCRSSLNKLLQIYKESYWIKKGKEKDRERERESEGV